jgi:hypothetical protein
MANSHKLDIQINKLLRQYKNNEINLNTTRKQIKRALLHHITENVRNAACK